VYQQHGDPPNRAFNMIRDLIHERTGLQYENSRLDILADKINMLLKAGNFQSLWDYYYFLKYENSSGEAWNSLHSALAVNETYFWREHDQIQTVAEVIVPKLLRERPRQPVRIWHAACATGEEPYSMAIALQEAGCLRPGQVVIDATDFNTAALDQARSGLYRQRSFRRIPADILQRYFTPEGEKQHRVINSIRDTVSFSNLNLLDGDGMARMRNYDIIMCRNVFIYFSDQAIRRVAGWMYDSLNETGVLFVAAVESLLRITNLFELTEIQNVFAYRKRSHGEKGA
jgi:chemotaxis protein methyltransferase CheR